MGVSKWLRFARPQSGFTLLEILVVLAVISIIGAMAVPTWSVFLERWRVSDAQSKVYSAIRQTQLTALKNRAIWQLSIRETLTGEVEWAMHSKAGAPTQWMSLGDIALDIDLADTTLDKRDGAYYVRFDYKGRLASRTRTLTLTSSRSPSIKRCVVMSTTLGAMRQSQEQGKSNSSGRYCY
ncbi:MAG: type II secretion system protein [Cyanobacteria bacterium P01_F01_bin.13]